MHSKEDLESKKKDELREIVKNLGLKGRRLKAELIDLILQHQSDVDPSASPKPAPDIESDNEDLVASAALDVASAIKADGACKEALESDCAAASDSENSNTSILDVENMLSKDNLDSDLNLSKKVSRSSTENILEKDAKKEIPSRAEPSPRPRMKRSNTFHLDPPAITSSTINPGASPPTTKGRAKRLHSVSPRSEEPTLLAVKRTRKSRILAATVAATLPRRGRRGTVIPHPDNEPRRHSRGSLLKAPAVQCLPSEKTTPELGAEKGRPQLRSNSSRVLQRTPLIKEDVSEETLTERTILTPKRTLKTILKASSATKTKLPNLKQLTPVLAVAGTPQQTNVASPVVNSPATVSTIVPQTSVLENSLQSIPATEAHVAVEAPVSAKRLSHGTSLIKPASVLPSGESLSAVASPRLSVVTALGRRLSSAKRLSSASSLTKRVVPTLAQPVFTIGKHDKKEQNKDGSQSCGKPKSSIPRFMAYAQKINKMPNFKRIHEKAFNNMQNLDEFVSKKNQLSNSVQKASRPSASFVPSIVSTKGMKLNFSDKSPVVKFGSGAATTTPLQTPRLSLAHAKRVAFLGAADAAMPRQASVSVAPDRVYSARKTSLSAAFAVSLKENIRPGSPRVSLATPSRVAPRNAVIKTMPSGARTKGSQPQASPNSAAPSGMQHRAAFKARSEMHSFVKANKANVSVVIGVAAGSRPASKLPQYKPYRGRLHSPGTNRAALKHLASKRPAITTREERRDRNKEYIKGVRTNKRFQLQMERRGVMP